MREITTVMKGNFRKNKGSYISIAVLLFVVSVALTTVFSILINTNNRDKEAIETTGFGHIFAAIRYELNDTDYLTFCEGLADDLEACEGVERVDEIPCLLASIEDLNGKRSASTVFLLDYKSDFLKYDIYDERNCLIEKPVLNPGEICVPVCFKSIYNCEIGDVLTIGFAENEFEFEIVSYFEDPYMGSSLMGIKTMLMCQEDCEKIATSSEQYGEGRILSIFKEESNTLNDVEFEAMLNKETSYAGYSWITLSRSQAYNYMTMLTNIFAGILIAFIVMLVIATLIVLSHNLSNSIEQDYVNMGILKAIGMTNGKLRLSILLGYVVAGGVGTIVGIPVAIPVTAKINELITPTTGLYVPSTPALSVSGLIIFSIFVILIVFIQIKLRKITGITPVSAINNGRKDVYFSSLLKLPISKRLFGTSLAYRQIMSSKKQYAGAVIITAILVLFMTLISDMCIWFGDGGEALGKMFSPVNYNFYVMYMSEEIQNEAEAEVEAIIHEYTEAEKFQYGSNYLLLNDTQIWCGLVSDANRYETVYEGRTCLYDNEILITEYVTEQYGIEIGDTVELKLEGKSAEYIVSGYYQCSNDSGKNISMTLDGYKRLVEDLELNAYVYLLEDNTHVNEIIESIQEKYDEEQVVVRDSDVFDGMDVIINAVNGIAVVIYILATVFIIVTVIMVCSKLFAKEKQDYGIYKAMGMTSSILRRQFAMRFVLASFIGSAFGIILTLLLSDVMVGAIFASFGISNFSSNLNVGAVILPVAFMAVVYYLFSYFVSRKMKKVTPRVLIGE